jgi:hypothetical protein
MGKDKWMLGALAAASVSTSASTAAQDVRPLVGSWVGDVAETVDGETVRYRMYVTIDVDRRGHPVAAVHYSLECTGVWTGARESGGTWRFEETVTSGRANCASHADGELVAGGGTLRVRLHPVGYPDQLAQAVLRRTSESSSVPGP